jgi:Spy/CpxP family protein refolding chaperone
MKSIRKHLIAGLIATCVGAGSFAAFAQTPPAGAPQKQDRGAMMEHMKERMQKRAAELHDKLKLNASQEAAWKTYMAKMQPGQPPARPDRAEMEKLSAPERMDRMLALMKEHEKRMEARVAATKEFYAVLTPEQQKTFNAEFGHGWGFRHDGFRHRDHSERGEHMPPAGK